MANIVRAATMTSYCSTFRSATDVFGKFNSTEQSTMTAKMIDKSNVETSVGNICYTVKLVTSCCCENLKREAM